jgi:hypothetical protein
MDGTGASVVEREERALGGPWSCRSTFTRDHVRTGCLGPTFGDMTDKRLWTIGGVLFIVAAIASLIGDNVAMAGAFIAIGLLFLVTPSYLEGRSRKRQ